MNTKTKKRQGPRNVQLSGDGYYGAKKIEAVKWPFSHEAVVYPVYPFVVEETIRQNRFKFKELYCKLFIAVLILDGMLFYRFNGREVTLVPGQLLTIPPGSDYEFDSGKSGSYHKLVLELNGVHLSSMCTQLNLAHIQIFPLADSEIFKNIIYGIRDKLRSRAVPAPELAAEGYAFLLRVAGLNTLRNSAATVLARAQLLLESRKFSGMADCAEKLGIGESTLNHLFRRHLSMTPVEYRNGKLIEQGCELLSKSSYSIKEIADHLGFCNQFYFSQLFRKLKGVAPSEFRRNTCGG